LCPQAYGELPENAKINETDTYGEDGGEGGVDFADDDQDVDIDDL
jgi:translation initiation factor 1A